MKNLNVKLAAAMMVAAVVLGGSVPARAHIGPSFSNPSLDGVTYTATAGSIGGTGTALGLGIPDNNASGLAFALDFGASGPVQPNSVQVTLNIAGGYNGDLTVYLQHGSSLVYLLSTTPSMSSSGLNNVTFVSTGGSSLPTDGTPITTGGSYTVSGLTAWDNTSANGNWTLFFADLSPGDTSTLNGYSVTSAVPEPVNVALAGFAGVMLTVVGVRRLIGSNRGNEALKNL